MEASLLAKVRLPKLIKPKTQWKTSEKRKYHNRPGNPNLYKQLVKTAVYMDAEDLLFAKAYARMAGTTVSRLIVGLLRTFKKQSANQKKASRSHVPSSRNTESKPRRDDSTPLQPPA